MTSGGRPPCDHSATGSRRDAQPCGARPEKEVVKEVVAYSVKVPDGGDASGNEQTLTVEVPAKRPRAEACRPPASGLSAISSDGSQLPTRSEPPPVAPGRVMSNDEREQIIQLAQVFSFFQGRQTGQDRDRGSDRDRHSGDSHMNLSSVA